MAPRTDGGASPAASTDAPAADAPPSADAGAPPAPTSWADAVRREQWDTAAQALESLSDVEKRKPEVVYVRARVAMARGQAKAALAMLTGLEDDLPLLAPDIARWQAEAKLVVGPYAEAGEYFAGRGTLASLLRASEAFEKAKDIPRARALCAKAASLDHRSRLDEAAARACRIRLADPGDRAGATDARWIAVHAPDAPSAKDADAALARLDAARPLTVDELLLRARTLADAGRTDDALRALDRLSTAPPPKIAHLDELRARGDILYRSRTKHLEAARVLDECAAAGGPHAAEDAFHAARALARADKDDEAIYRLTQLGRTASGTAWGDEATFFVPYLHMLHAKWREAARGFDEYAQKYPGGVEKKDALRDRALSHLMNGDAAVARRLFEQIAAEEGDTLGAADAIAMSALSALRDGDRTIAVARYTDVATSHPLSWPALVARARLKEIGAPIPPVVLPAADGAPEAPLAVALPSPVDLLHRVGLEGDAEIALRDREPSVSARAPAGRGLEALCTAYGLVGRGKRRAQLATQIPADLLRQAPTARTRWAWECAYPTPFAREVQEQEQALSLPPSLTFALMRQESTFDPDAISPAHAYGLMQLLPETASVVATGHKVAYDESRLLDPELNIVLGTDYLQELVTRFKGHLPLAVAAYNAGHESIVRWKSRAQGLDLDTFVERIPYAETRNYVARVMTNYAHYEYLRRGEEGLSAIDLGLSD